MDTAIERAIQNLGSSEDKVRFGALKIVLKATDSTVGWTYAVWDDLVARLKHDNSYQRSIAAMVLCNLARSDSEKRMNSAIDSLLHLTEDEKFVTSRQVLQNIWKVAASNQTLQKRIVEHLCRQYEGCANGKHYNLIRQDIIQSLRNLYDITSDAAIKERALQLIETEVEQKYRKKYATCWKDL